MSSSAVFRCTTTRHTHRHRSTRRVEDAPGTHNTLHRTWTCTQMNEKKSSNNTTPREREEGSHEDQRSGRPSARGEPQEGINTKRIPRWFIEAGGREGGGRRQVQGTATTEDTIKGKENELIHIHAHRERGIQGSVSTTVSCCCAVDGISARRGGPFFFLFLHSSGSLCSSVRCAWATGSNTGVARVAC